MLDVGCGKGLFSLACARNASQVVSIDVDITALKGISAPSNMHRLCCDAWNLPLKQESFDLVLAISSLEHIQSPEIALREFKHVLKPKQFLVIQLPTMQYFIGPHTRFLFLFMLPISKTRIMEQLGYYTNFTLSAKKLLLLTSPLFVQREIIPLYHKLKTVPWLPAWIIYMQNR